MEDLAQQIETRKSGDRDYYPATSEMTVLCQLLLNLFLRPRS